MPPRKSISRGSRRSLRHGDAVPADTENPPAAGAGAGAPPPPAASMSSSSQPAQPATTASIASSSKFTLDMAPPVHDSITHDYVPSKIVPQVFSEVDKERLVHEIMGFAPFNILHDISEHARNLIYPTVASVDDWARKMAGDNLEMEHEIDMGSVMLETLLENQVDRAFDRFTAYALRNTFKIPDGVEIVLAGADFDRAKFVTTLPDGEGALLSRLTALRRQVEQARLVKHRLAVAEAALDRKLALAAQRRAQVGFVRDGLVDADLHPLPDKAGALVQSMTDIHQQIADLEVPVAAKPIVQPKGETADGAWESGRQAYLSWALGRALAPEGSLAGVESDTRAVGSADEVAALAKIVK